jgi:hypothetical protein
MPISEADQNAARISNVHIEPPGRRHSGFQLDPAALPAAAVSASGDLNADASGLLYLYTGGGYGLVPAYQFVRADAANPLVGDTSEQPLFAAASDRITVVAGMTYRFQALITLTTGATSASVSFSLDGTATFTSSWAHSFGIHAASGTAGTPVMNNSAALGTAFAVVAAGTGVNKRFIVYGGFEVNAAGTVIPAVTFSAETTDVGSIVEFWQIGANPVTAVGPFA